MTCRKKVVLYQAMAAFFIATILFGGATFEAVPEVMGKMILTCEGDTFVFKGMSFSEKDRWNRGKATFLLRVVSAYPNQEFHFTPIHKVVLRTYGEIDTPKILTKAGQAIDCKVSFRPNETE